MSEPVSSSRDDLRLRPIDRHRPLPLTLDDAIAADDDVRIVEAFASQVECPALDAAVRSRAGTAGAPAYDPRLLLALCLYATIRGRFSFRELSEACTRDLPFLWLCGGSAPSYHTLSSFYCDHSNVLEPLLIDMLTALRQQKLVRFEELTVDGRKVPANASKESMHREKTLRQHHQDAEERVKRLQAERPTKGGKGSRRQAAQQSAAAGRLRRLNAALDTVRERTQQRQAGRGDPAQTRASETDADARKMKMSDGGYRPALNVQTVADAVTGLIVTVAVVDQACDNGLLAALVEQAEQATTVPAQRVLADAGYTSATDVETLEQAGTAVYMPAKNARKERLAGKDPYAPKRRDSRLLARWRQRMGQESAQTIYRRRAPVAEGVHARQSNRGFNRFRLRGLAKARTEALWHALAHNLRMLITRKWLTAGKVRPAAD